MSKQTSDPVAEALASDDLESSIYAAALAAVKAERGKASSRLELIRPAQGWGPPGVERQKTMESGSVEDVMKLDVEVRTLQAALDRCEARSRRLQHLYDKAKSKECAEGMPQGYSELRTAALSVVTAGEALLEAWAHADGVLQTLESNRAMARLFAHELPQADKEVLEAIRMAWGYFGSRYPVPEIAPTPDGRQRVADVLGFTGARAINQGMMPPEMRNYTIY